MVFFTNVIIIVNGVYWNTTMLVMHVVWLFQTKWVLNKVGPLLNDPNFLFGLITRKIVKLIIIIIKM